MTSPIAPTPHPPVSSHPGEQQPTHIPGQLTIFDITPEDTNEDQHQP